MNKDYIMIGCGGHAGVLLDILSMLDISVSSYVSPEEATNHSNFSKLNWIKDDSYALNLDPSSVVFINGIGSLPGNSNNRKEVFELYKQHNHTFLSIESPHSSTSSSCVMGEGVQISSAASIQVNTIIGENVIVNSGALIDHDCSIGSHTHVSPGATICGNVSIGSGTHIGAGATIIQDIDIGNNCVIGAGATVTKSVKDNHILYGFRNDSQPIKPKMTTKLNKEDGAKVLFFGRNDCEASEKILNQMYQNGFNVTYIMSEHRNQQLPEGILEWEGDYIICFRSLFILRDKLLKKAKIAAINFHPGPPEYPGSGCTNFALYDEVNTFGVTAHLMNAKVYNGKILEVRNFSVDESDTLPDLLERTHRELYILCSKFINAINNEGEAFLNLLASKCEDINWVGEARLIKELEMLQNINLSINKAELERIIRATNIAGFPPNIMFHGYKFYLNLDETKESQSSENIDLSIEKSELEGIIPPKNSNISPPNIILHGHKFYLNSDNKTSMKYEIY
jgi:sugar O-acyltransferase (sialic acid O-acetyltransferase NeuD family)